jgi:hypothetical protein
MLDLSILTPSMRMKLLDSLLKQADGDVRIDLRCTDVRVAEVHLNAAYVGAVVMQVSRERVA